MLPCGADGMQAFADPISLTTLPLERIEDAAELLQPRLRAGQMCGVQSVVWRRQFTSSSDSMAVCPQLVVEKRVWLHSQLCLMEKSCSFMFVGPDTPDVSFCDMMRGLLVAASVWWRPVKAAEGKTVGSRASRADAFGLERMVVSPAVQAGTRALRFALSEADAAGSQWSSRRTSRETWPSTRGWDSK